MANSTEPRKPHRYKLTYKVDAYPEGLERTDLEKVPDRIGACDAILVASVMFPADGSYSVLFMSKDGRTDKDLDDNEWYKIWAMLTERLTQSKTLSPHRHEFVKTAWDIFMTVEGVTPGSCDNPHCAVSHHER